MGRDLQNRLSAPKRKAHGIWNSRQSGAENLPRPAVNAAQIIQWVGLHPPKLPNRPAYLWRVAGLAHAETRPRGRFFRPAGNEGRDRYPKAILRCDREYWPAELNVRPGYVFVRIPKARAHL